MFWGKIKFFAFIYLSVFILIFVIGLAFQVTILANLYRAFLGALLFSGTGMILVMLIKIFVIQDLLKEAEEAEQQKKETLGTSLDLTVSDEHPLDYSNLETAAAEQFDQDLNALASQQIDPQFTRIINSDPERLAQIVKKMGFEDKS